MSAAEEQLAPLLDALRGAASETWPDPGDAAGAAGRLMQAALTSRGMWEKIPTGHRAAIIRAQVPFTMSRPELAALVEHTALVCSGAAPRRFPSEMANQFAQAAEVWRRLEQLPDGWRQEAVRAVLDDLTTAVGRMQITINRARSSGIDPDVDAEGP